MSNKPLAERLAELLAAATPGKKNALPEIITAPPGRTGFGPEWFQDKTRPEAIRALAQMERDHKKLFGARADELAGG